MNARLFTPLPTPIACTSYEAAPLRRNRLSSAAALLAAAFLAWAPAVYAQEPAAEPSTDGRNADIDRLDRERQQTETELERLAERITLSDDNIAALEAEVESLRKDQATLRTNLIEAAERQREQARKIEAIESDFVALRQREAEITHSLSERRGVLAEVLAGLQRMGLNPPPALLVSADDALASVRSAILLGSIVPEMRAQTERLVADLEALVTVRSSIEEEKAALIAAHSRQAEEEERLALLLQEKEELAGERQQALDAERRAAEELAARSSDLEELIDSLETQIASVREAERRAQEATRLRERRTAEQLEEARELARRGELDMDRIAPAIAFDAQRGRLRLPVEGEVERTFGDDDGAGHTLQGIMVTSRSGAVVQAPADGWVVYSGPFRSYGQLLILNAGDEYHIVMAGMDRINVSPGQFVVAGEPVATMGATRLAGATALALASTQPTLYIEFRKGGQPIDPDPWWANETSEG